MCPGHLSKVLQNNFQPFINNKILSFLKNKHEKQSSSSPKYGENV